MYTSYADLLKDVEVYKKIPLDRVVLFSGKVGELEYKNQVTTLGRLRISRIINADLDSIPGVITTKLGKIDAGAVARLTLYMQQFPEYVERMQELQKYALKVVTRKGVITFDFDTLYAKTDTETYESIKKISEDPRLTDQQKVLLMNDAYKKYLSEIKDTIREDVKKDVKDANRVKIDSIVDMVAPSFIISGVDEKPIINRSKMIAGMNSKDYIYHAIENRGLQSIKQSGTPSSGYLTRQLKFLMNGFIYKIGEDPNNKGIMIPRYRSEGRTSPNGKIYPKFSGKPDPKDIVPVRSIVSKENYDFIVTSDLISNLYTDIEDGNPIGLSFSSGITQSITQGALSFN